MSSDITYLKKNLSYDNIYKSMEKYMREAMLEAKKAENIGEVPVGAVIVKDGDIIARGFNMCISLNDTTAHAEIVAIRNACKLIGNYRLCDCDLYVTCEPCVMCAGAIVGARIRRLIIAAMDSKAGACGSVFDIPNEDSLNHRVEVVKGVLAKECSEMMSAFFRKLRKKKLGEKNEEV